MSDQDLCKSCKQPFVAVHRIATVGGAAEVRSQLCPDCAAGIGPKPAADLDCYEYSRPYRVGVRLRDGFAMLRGAA